MINSIVSLFTTSLSDVLSFDYIIYFLIACLTLSTIVTIVRYLIKGCY